MPSKNYEHAMAGLVNVVTNRAAQKRFSLANAVTVSGDSGMVDLILDDMLRFAEEPETTEAELVSKAAAAKRNFTWELGVEPGLNAQLLQLLGRA